MIQSKADLRHYIQEDRKARHKSINPTLKERFLEWLFPDFNMQYTYYLRKLEYYTNCNNLGSFRLIFRWFLTRKLTQLKYKTGIEIQPNCAGPGLHITHGKIVINGAVKLGCYCKIHSDVTIGVQGRYDRPGAPMIGDRVFIGSGARIIGNITIADDVVIGANAVVVSSITEPNITVGGNPAQKISNTGSHRYIFKN